MAAKKKDTTPVLSEISRDLLARAVDGRVNPIYLDEQLCEPLLKWHAGSLIEFNPSYKNDQGTLCRASALGVELLGHQMPAATLGVQGSSPITAASLEPVDVASEFEIELDIAIPPQKRFGRGQAKKYPFHTMPINGSFFIPKTDTNPKPSKRIASVVSLASKNLAPKKFKVQSVNEAGGKGEGARIWRLQDEVASDE